MRCCSDAPGRRRVVKVVISILVGGTLGYLYYRFIGCASGHCPITRNPYASTLYGAVVGALAGLSM